MLRIVMIWQSQSYNKNGNHTITFAQQIHNGEQSKPHNSKLFKFLPRKKPNYSIKAMSRAIPRLREERGKQAEYRELF